MMRSIGSLKCAFCFMLCLFCINTIILTRHMDRNDFYFSIKGRLELLKQRIPWAQSIRDSVTDNPDKPKPGGKGSLRGGPIVPVAPAQKQPDPIVVNQRGRKGGRSPSAGDGDHDEYRFVWEESSGSTRFVQLDGDSWGELHDGKVAFRFVEKQRKLGEKTVELYDTSRDMTILLLDTQSLLQQDPKGDFGMLYNGYWKTFDGKAQSPPFGNYDGEHFPPPPYVEGELSDQTIVVMLAAYRDPLCGNTLLEAFGNAEYPNRISAVVVQQNHPSDEDCLEDYCNLAKAQNVPCYRDRVKVESVSLDHARGVMPARYRQNLLLDDQEFCLQIDSHSAFEDKWDTIALEDWQSAQNEMAVITAYPNMVKDRHDQRHSPARCSTKFSNDNEVVHGGNSALNVRPGKTPYLIPFFGAGTSFSKCHANYNVPYDPYMSHLFGGEEFNRAIRLFTSGYDMYAPKRNFVYHYYDADKKPAQGDKPRHREFFQLHGKQKQIMGRQTTARWRSILGLPLTPRNPDLSEKAMESAELFGLGNRRRIEQYEAFSGVNLRQHTTKNKCDELGRMRWQPYVFSAPFYPSGEECPYRLAKDIKKYCCTTLSKVSDNTLSMLSLSNEDLANEIENSPVYDRENVLEPIITNQNNNAKC